MQSYLILVVIVGLTICGDFALKCASLKNSPLVSTWFMGGTLLYAGTALGWVFLMQSHNLTQIAVLYSAATILALTAVGYGFFGESVSTKQLIALCAALLSVVLIQAEA